MNKFKMQMRRLLVSLCIISLLMPLCQPLTAQAYMKPTETVTEFSSSTLPDDDWPTSYDARIEGRTITFDVGCPEASTSAILGGTWSATLMVTNSGSIEYAYADFPSDSGSCSISMDLSGFTDGLKSVYIDIYAGDTKMYRAVSGVTLEVANGEVGLYSSYGQAAIDDIAYYNEHYTPELYTNPATGTALNNPYAEYEDFISKAEEITAGCTTDLGKIVAIYDWMCTNLAYDYEALNSGSFEEQLKANDEGYMLTSLRGFCGAFMDLALILFRAAGIPSATVDGYAKSTGLDDGTEDTLSVNHGWVIIYYEGSWHYVDPTWGCQNKYYGEGDSRNKSGKAPDYRYLGTSAAIFGETHYEQGTNPCPHATGLKVTGGKTQYLLGEEFAKDYSISYIVSTGGTWKEDGIGLGECTGYDMNTLGKQTVTVSYRGFTGTYEIEVVDPNAITGITVEPNTDKTYKVGDTFAPDIKLYLNMADGTKKEVTDMSEVLCSGYDMTKVGKQTVTVSYKGFETTYEITVSNSVEIVGIIVVPYKTTYISGSDLLTNKNKIYYVMSDGTEQKISNSSAKYSGYDKFKLGKQTITVTCKGYTTTYEIVVVESASDTGNTEYKVGSVKLSKTSYTYTGKYIMPTVTVKDSNNKIIDPSYYSVRYYNNKNVGTAKVAISFLGAYYFNEGIEKTFTINPKGTKISELKAGAKKLTVKIKAQKTETTGYQIRYSLKKNMKGAKTLTLKKNTQLSKAITKLKKKKTYYVQVRTYKKVSGKNYYSSWSKSVSKKTK